MLNNKVVVVTGGAGLLGRSFIKAIVENGGIAIIADANAELGTEAASTISQLLDEEVGFEPLNITSRTSIIQCIDNINTKYGKIDALVNNAYPRNKNYGKHFFDVKYDDFVENVGLNLGGYFLTSQQFAKYFRNQGYGNIINIASIYGSVTPKFEVYDGTDMTMPVEYTAIKSGLIHLTKYMAKYFKGENIRVNSLSPGGIYDNQPQEFLQQYKSCCLNKGMLDAKDLDGAIIFLLSEMSQYINGQNIIVDDGFIL